MQLWPKIAAHFGMETGPNLHISLDRVMNTPDKKDIWAKTVKVSSSLDVVFLWKLCVIDMCERLSEIMRKVTPVEEVYKLKPDRHRLAITGIPQS